MSRKERLFGYVRRERSRYLLGGGLTVLYALSFQLIPLAVRDVVDGIQRELPLAEVSRGVAWLVGAAVVYGLLRLGSRVVVFRAARQIEYELRNDLFSHLQRLPQSYFALHRTGDLMSRAVNDIQSVRLFIGMGLLHIVSTPVLYLGALAVMLFLDPVLTLFVVLPYPLFILIGRMFGWRMHRANLASQVQLGRLSTAVQENAAGVLVVRAYAMEGRERERFEIENEALYGRQFDLARINASLQPIVALLPGFALIFVLLVGGMRVQAGAMTQADLWAFAMYIFQLTFPTFLMGWVIAIAQRGLAALDRLGEVLDSVPTIRDGPQSVAVPDLRGRVELRGLTLSYPGRRDTALRGLHLEVEPGQTVGIVGTVGSGKTTLVSVIPRLIEIPEGTVFIDGVDVNRIRLHDLRRRIAMVPQESFLFSATIEENLAFGEPDADPARIRDAARRAHIHREIEDQPHGYATPVGERGITLSGGQRQRIALARALLLDPAILILDDSLSSLDAETEEAILKELRTARAGRTCFIVAHRLSAVRDADRIVVLEEGRVVEQGKHAELLSEGGAYARIFEHQRLEAELEAEVSA
ncbi:MAG: ABC transporter ATP-binding protein [Myxococcota bacterium]